LTDHIDVRYNVRIFNLSIMTSKATIPITEARKKIYQIAEETQTPGVIFTITEKGYAKMVMMSFEEFESWQETIETINEFPDIEKDIAKAEKDYKDKSTTSLADFKKQLKKSNVPSQSVKNIKKRTK